MADLQKLVLILQTNKLQGLIWQAVLKSQQVAVIWESADTNLVESLDQLKSAGLTQPDLLLLDMKLPDFNPYAFCRWCREHYPGVRIILTNPSQKEIPLSERQWAVNQGASDLLPSFQRENLVSGVAGAVKRVLEVLDGHPLNNGALISVLLAMKRELEARTGDQSSSQRSGSAIAPAPKPSIPATRYSVANSQPPQSNGNHSPDLVINVTAADADLVTIPLESEEPADAKSANDTVDGKGSSQNLRRYRGLYY